MILTDSLSSSMPVVKLNSKSSMRANVPARKVLRLGVHEVFLKLNHVAAESGRMPEVE